VIVVWQLRITRRPVWAWSLYAQGDLAHVMALLSAVRQSMPRRTRFDVVRTENLEMTS